MEHVIESTCGEVKLLIKKDRTKAVEVFNRLFTELSKQVYYYSADEKNLDDHLIQQILVIEDENEFKDTLKLLVVDGNGDLTKTQHITPECGVQFAFDVCKSALELTFSDLLLKLINVGWKTHLKEYKIEDLTIYSFDEQDVEHLMKLFCATPIEILLLYRDGNITALNPYLNVHFDYNREKIICLLRRIVIQNIDLSSLPETLWR